MRYLVDGYNLLFALGRLTRQSQRSALEQARKWLLARVRLGHAEADEVLIVFDGQGQPDPQSSTVLPERIRSTYSLGKSADDVIEEFLEGARDRGQLTVVSDDRRLKEACRRRGCIGLACLDYAEHFLLDPRSPPRSSPQPQPTSDKPSESSPEESQRWLEAFGEADGPAW